MNSLLWKRRIGKLWPIFFQSGHARKIILIYHAVGGGPWSIPTEAFEKQVQWLKKNCNIVSLNELLKNRTKDSVPEVSLTFDDGYACLYETVFPILQAENIVATVYINTGWISACEKARQLSNPNLGHYPDEKFLTWHEVKTLEKFGWEIGSHGVDHLDLTQQKVGKIQQELMDSKLAIENALKKKCVHFAYTWGRNSQQLRNLVFSSGYQYAAAGYHAIYTEKCDLFALPRINIAKEYLIEDIQNIVFGKWDFLGRIHRIKRCL